MELNIPSIEGIGGSLHLPGRSLWGPDIYDVDFIPESAPAGGGAAVGLVRIDHLTHNVGAAT